MPEFVMPIGDTRADYQRWNELHGVVQGYIEAMFFTSTGHSEDNDLHEASFAELSERALCEINFDVGRFLGLADKEGLLNQGTHDSEQLGRDFWYTRNGHGVGFWDRDPELYGSEAVLTALTMLAKTFGESDLYRGDDGKLYLA